MDTDLEKIMDSIKNLKSQVDNLATANLVLQGENINEGN